MATPKITIVDRKTSGKPKRLRVDLLKKKRGWISRIKSFFMRK